jgi:hypothetical protein
MIRNARGLPAANRFPESRNIMTFNRKETTNANDRRAVPISKTGPEID